MKDNEKIGKAISAFQRKFGEVTARFRQQADLDDQLVDAVIEGNEQKAKKLINKGADPNGNNSLALMVAVSAQNNTMLSVLVEDGGAKVGAHGQVALRVAIGEGRTLMSYRLLTLGADIDELGRVLQETGSAQERKAYSQFCEKRARGIASSKKRYERKQAKAGPQ